MELLIGLILGLVIGWHYHAWKMVQRMVENPDAFIELAKQVKEKNLDVEEIAKKSSPNPIRTEFLQGQCYLWEGETFLAQGSTVSEAMANAEKRFPNRKFTFRVNIPNESNQST